MRKLNKNCAGNVTKICSWMNEETLRAVKCENLLGVCLSRNYHFIGQNISQSHKMLSLLDYKTRKLPFTTEIGVKKNYVSVL